MAKLVLFAQAREMAGTSQIDADISTVSELEAWCAQRFGPSFLDVWAISSVWVNGEPVSAGQALHADDEVAILPPVSGG
ncbi:MAG: MoaD/ThiS family protein [Acidimicrobiia bacterium]|nr:MoaD/ThiS family protein [Acidimicrobiia bacterium]MBP8181188.1 MoaD/ThiS family protein [Acidimicrobiia bacterium]